MNIPEREMSNRSFHQHDLSQCHRDMRVQFVRFPVIFLFANVISRERLLEKLVFVESHHKRLLEIFFVPTRPIF